MKRALVCALLLAAPPVLAQTAQTAPTPPQVEVSLTPREGTVGDRIEAVLTLRADPAALTGEPRFPAWGTTWGDAEILEKAEPQRLQETETGGSGATVWRQRIVLAAFRPGQVDLPPVDVAVPLRDQTTQAQTPAGLSFTLRSVLPAGEEPAPKPPAPPRQLPIGDAFWWTLAGSLLVLLAVAWALRRRLRAEAAAAEIPRPALPPFEELLGELDRLAAEPSVVRLHTRLSLALRSYLSRSLSFPAAESTTSEIHRILLSRRVPGAVVRQMVELLRACDMVKFARQEVGEERAQERIATARQLAREVETWTRPVEPVDMPHERLEATG
jgi:hypothetical protein